MEIVENVCVEQLELTTVVLSFNSGPRTAEACVGQVSCWFLCLLWVLVASRHQPSSTNQTRPSTSMWEDKCTRAAWGRSPSTPSHGGGNTHGAPTDYSGLFCFRALVLNSLINTLVHFHCFKSFKGLSLAPFSPFCILELYLETLRSNSGKYKFLQLVLSYKKM